MATIDYMIASYGAYSASATGGNGFSRDFLAGIAAMYSTPSQSPIYRFDSHHSQDTVYSNIGKRPIQYASTVLACLAVVVTFPIYIFYWKGPIIREKSKFAQVLASDLKAGVGGSSKPGRPSDAHADASHSDKNDNDRTEIDKEKQEAEDIERKEHVEELV